MRLRRWFVVAGITSLLGMAVVVGMARRAHPAAIVVAGAPANVDEPSEEPVSSPAPAPAPAPARAIVGGERARLRRQLVASLGDLRSRVAACNAHERGGRSIQHGQRAEETVLTLNVEVLDGQMKVVDAPLQTQGTASGAFVACAQSSLRGQVVHAPAAKAGGRIRMPLRLGFRTGVAPD